MKILLELDKTKLYSQWTDLIANFDRHEMKRPAENRRYKDWFYDVYPTI